MVLLQAHGILTGQSDPTWPQYGDAWFAAHHPQVRTVNTRYYQLPFPRVAAIKNTRRSRDLSRQVTTAVTLLAEQTGTRPTVSMVAHSNGGVIAMQVARALIAKGQPVESMILIAPALRTSDASREIAGWLDTGMLETALLVRPTRDLVIGGIATNWQSRALAWPWGALGHEGWDVAEIEHVFPNIPMTKDLPGMGHSDPTKPHNRAWLYESIIAPALGLGEKTEGTADER